MDNAETGAQPVAGEYADVITFSENILTDYGVLNQHGHVGISAIEIPVEFSFAAALEIDGKSVSFCCDPGNRQGFVAVIVNSENFFRGLINYNIAKINCFWRETHSWLTISGSAQY